jgi:hypothetical protein
MNPGAADMLADALEEDIRAQEQGRFIEIGEKWDDVYAELLPIEDDIDNPIYSLAFRFWDDWGDASKHDWLYHEPISKEQWPIYAKEIAASLRDGILPESVIIAEEILPKPKVGLIQKLKQWLS